MQLTFDGFLAIQGVSPQGGVAIIGAKPWSHQDSRAALYALTGATLRRGTERNFGVEPVRHGRNDPQVEQ